MRSAEFSRKTKETDIKLKLTLEGKGVYTGETTCGFLDHMLDAFCKHSRFDIEIEASGDTYVDFHHLTEDIGIALGTAFKKALGDMKGITRYGYFILPMDEALVLTSVDISGRALSCVSLNILAEQIGNGFDTELCEEFWVAFARSALLTLHIRQLCGTNSHHIIEAVFKSCARSLKQAAAIDESIKGERPSSKGVL